MMELIPQEGLPRIAHCEPAGITVEPGKVYSWCSCGLSEKEPFCDSSHKNVAGTPFRSVKVVFEKEWYSTVEARKQPGNEGNHNVDDQAAAIVLQRYLDKVNGPGTYEELEDSDDDEEDDFYA